MTTDRQMAKAYAVQEEVIAALRSIGDLNLAERLEDCTTTRLARHSRSGWPHICRSAACVWCRRPMMRAWWNGIRQWTAEATTRSLAITPLHLSAGLPDAVRRLRRGLRDVRDRMARHKRQWREVSFAGMAGGDHMAWVLVSHQDIDRREIENVLRHRWPDLVMKSLENEEPGVAMLPGDAAALGRCRRGVEPLRIVIMPQHDRQIASPHVAPCRFLCDGRQAQQPQADPDRISPTERR
jgi:hypothetical protein